jgi:hypothetical protein
MFDVNELVTLLNKSNKFNLTGNEEWLVRVFEAGGVLGERLPSLLIQAARSLKGKMQDNTLDATISLVTWVIANPETKPPIAEWTAAAKRADFTREDGMAAFVVDFKSMLVADADEPPLASGEPATQPPMSMGETCQERIPAALSILHLIRTKPDGTTWLYLDQLRAHPANKLHAGMQPKASVDDSIRDHGILVAMEITYDGRVLDGATRLELARKHGKEEGPVTVFPSQDEHEFLRRIFVLNQRADSTKGVQCMEMVIVRQIENEEARRRQLGLVPKEVTEGGDARDRAGKQFGVSGPTADLMFKIGTAMTDALNQGQTALVELLMKATNKGFSSGLREVERTTKLAAAPTADVDPKQAVGLKLLRARASLREFESKFGRPAVDSLFLEAFGVQLNRKQLERLLA